MFISFKSKDKRKNHQALAHDKMTKIWYSALKTAWYKLA